MNLVSYHAHHVNAALGSNVEEGNEEEIGLKDIDTKQQ